jgi:hypothetical protein
MLKNLKHILIGVFSAIILVALGASAISAFASPSEDVVEPVQASAADFGYGSGNGTEANGNGTGTSVLDLPASDLSADEAASLIFMREEEKLARDVYNALYAVWSQPTFVNIAASEQAHMDEIKVLLDRYGLTDPAQGTGVFTNPDLQALYDQLVAQGSVSLADALKVGAAIEEIDILDLQERLALTDNLDIQTAFNNLLSGSANHLRAFTSVLFTQTGETYIPQYLTADAYQAILDGSNQAGYGSQGSQGYGNQSGTSQGNGGGYRGGKNNTTTTTTTGKGRRGNH